MKKKLHVQTSALSNTIYCGHLLMCGKLWASNKTDVTVEALHAVKDHVIEFGGEVILEDGLNKFSLVAKKIGI